MTVRIFKLVGLLVAGLILNIALGLVCAAVPFGLNFNSPMTEAECWAAIERYDLCSSEQRAIVGIKGEKATAFGVGREFILIHSVPQSAIMETTAPRDDVDVAIFRSERGEVVVRCDEMSMQLTMAMPVQAGWPCRVLAGASIERPDAPAIARGGFYDIFDRQARFLPLVIPLNPIWPGFAINTIFYAAVLWVLFAVPFKVRRWRRIKRGHCASCGYSLHGNASNTCPECGAIV